MKTIAILAANWQEDLSNGNSSTSALWFTESTPHTSLKPISSSTWKHFVDTQDMEWVNTDSQMESIFPGKLGHIFVASNSSSLKSFTRYVLLFPRHQVHTEREFINPFLLHSNIIDPDLGIRHTTTKAWFRIRLIFYLAITPSRSCNNKKSPLNIETSESPIKLKKQPKSPFWYATITWHTDIDTQMSFI